MKSIARIYRTIASLFFLLALAHLVAAQDARYSISSDGREVTDSKTALTWKRCAEGANWDGVTCSGKAQSFAGLSRVLAYQKGLRGWRVPTIEELETVGRVYPDHGSSNTGGVDLLAFPGFPSDAFWSSTLYYKDRGDRDRTKIVHFANGMVGFRDNGEGGLLLLVKTKEAPTGSTSNEGVQVVAKTERATKAVAPGQRYSVSADGREVTDHSTGLIWRRCPEGMSASGSGCSGKALTFDFASAQARAQVQAKATKVDWRMPDRDELRSIGDPSRHSQAIDSKAFPGTPYDYFWTSHRTDAQYAYAINFYNGDHYTRYYTNQHYVRLVREAK
jgi:predicted secreted protein